MPCTLCEGMQSGVEFELSVGMDQRGKYMLYKVRFYPKLGGSLPPS